MKIVQRHKHILVYIPEDPDSISTSRLLSKFQENSGDITLRMLQRDMEKLYKSEINIIKKKVGQNNEWALEAGTKKSQIMTPSVALAFNMFAEYANHLLPSSVNEKLQGQFNQAKRALLDPKLASWQSKIAIAQSGFQLHKAEVDTQILDTVEQAIIDQAQLEVTYRNRPQPHAENVVKKRLINPLALVIRGNIYYLIASTPEEQLRTFALHRMSSAQKSYNDVEFPRAFNLQDFMKSGNIAFPTNKTIEIALKVDRIRGCHLLETKLCPEQTVFDYDEQYFVIKATLHESHELHWWLMSIADFSEVIAPQSLRNVIICNLQKALNMYNQ